MKKIFTRLILAAFLMLAAISAEAACNWKGRITSLKFNDTCKGYGGKTSVTGSISLNNTSCVLYIWKLNNTTVSKSYTQTSITNYITQNGTYNLCLTLYDTCKRCDTTICSSFSISCFPACNWKGRYPTFYTWDTCQGPGKKNSVNGYLSFNSSASCFKYQWTLNNTAVSKNNTSFNKITANGTYVLCVKVTDTCNKCDTTFCRTFNVTCFTSPCDWKKDIKLVVYNKCANNKDSMWAYISSNYKIYCGKIRWKLNNTPINNINSATTYLQKAFTQNGTYTLCASIIDTCNKCDTTLCSTFTVSCLSSSSCKSWKSRGLNITYTDTCQGVGKINNINGFVGLTNDSCVIYKWIINNSAYVYGKKISYKVTRNGTYQMCLLLYDTCRKCDTMICRNFNVTCFPNCNWKSKIYSVYVADTCRGYNAKNNIAGRVYFNTNVPSGCFKYEWTVNGVVKGDGIKFNYMVPENGTYKVCLKITDTCNKCDTIICQSKTFNCINNPCQWKKAGGINVYNNCGTYYDTLRAYYYNNYSVKCSKLVWLLNGNPIAHNTTYFNKVITQNGNYTLCLKIMDTCNMCDTVYCSSFTVNCTKNTCKWYARNPQVSVWDTCQGTGGKNSLSGSVSYKNTSTCIKYNWTVNNINVSKSSKMFMPIYKNGTYNVCLYILDSCDKCDTTICFTKTISCFQTCNWKKRNPYFYTWDTCKGNSGTSVNGYISFNSNNGNCLKYSWTVNGYASGNKNVMNRRIYANGTYVICVKVFDSCNKCDTVFCATKTINCFKKCNFKSRSPYFAIKDSCSSTGASLSGYISFTNSSCLKYNWTVNNANAGTGNSMKYKITKNGTYVLCVKVTDTCNRCDTTICKTVNFNCSKLGTASLETKGPDVSVYPNPAGDRLNVELPYTLATYEISNILGVCVNKGKLEEGNNVLNTEALPNGVYILNVVTDYGAQTIRIVINR